MRLSKLVSVTALAATALAGGGVLAAAIGACAEDSATVRVRPEGGATDAGEQVTLLTCGVPVPLTYDSPAFATNAKEELDLAQRAIDLDDRMKAAEGSGTSIVTADDLRAIYTQGTPSLKDASTSAAQAIVDGYFVAFGDAAGKTWAPEQIGADGGPTTGGKYAGAGVVSLAGLDLREAATKVLLGGALYDHALVLASGPVTAATVDRFVAAFGATPKLSNTTDPDAGADADRLIAAYASRRDDRSKDSGLYRRISFALRSMKAAAEAGDTCKADLDAALAVFLASWEKATYASAIFALNDAAAKALANPQDGPGALRSFGEAVGFITSFKGLAPDRRRITDAQIDDLLASVGETTAYQLVTDTGTRVPKLVAAIQTIAGIYEFSPADVEGFEKSF
jgi:hypothetical protein